MMTPVIVAPKLVIYRAGIRLREARIPEGSTKIGRRADNNVVIDHLHVSGHHATITRLEQILFVQDAQSTNGTYLNGRRITRQSLKHLDTIEIGPFQLTFYEIDDTPTE